MTLKKRFLYIILLNGREIRAQEKKWEAEAIARRTRLTYPTARVKVTRRPY